MASLVSESRFKTIAVSKRTSIKALTEEKSLRFKKGRGFYQLNKPKLIQDYKNVVVRRRSDGKFESQDKVREILGAPTFSEKVRDFDIFVQATSVNCVLLPGTEFLYEIEEEEGTDTGHIPAVKRRSRRRGKRKPKATVAAEPLPGKVTEKQKDTTDGAELLKPKVADQCPLEIVFSFDTTASMYPCLIQVRQKVSEMVERLQREIPGIRIAIIGHGDYCDGPNTLTTMDFSSDEKKLCDFVKKIPRTGGDDIPECYELVLNEVREKLSWTPGTQRSLVMIGDATPHPPSYPQNQRKLDWRVEAKKLHKLGVRIYAVQALNQSESDSFYQTLASLTGGHHLCLDDFSSIVDFIMAICFREQSIEKLKAYEDEVRSKRSYRVNPSTQKFFDELAGRETTHSGHEERILLLKRKLGELDDELRPQREQIKEYERELSQLQKEQESRKDLSEREWQDIRKGLKSLEDQLRRHADLLQNEQHQQLSEALGLPEKQPMEVLETHVAFEKREVAVAETQAWLTRQKQLTEYRYEARDLAGRLQNYEELLKKHMVAMKERKEALAELESYGEKYTKELTECDQQLEQLREQLDVAQTQLRSFKEKLQEYIEKFEECLDEMNKCEGTLALSLVELMRCLDRLKKLREKLTEELQSLDNSIQMGKNLINILIRKASRLLGYSDDQLEEKKAELQKCNEVLEATEGTLERCKKTLQDFEMELGQLKEGIKKAKVPLSTSAIMISSRQLHQSPSTDDRARFMAQSEKSSSIYAQVSKERERIIEFLSANVSPDRLASELEIIGLINKDIRGKAEVTTIPVSERIRPVMNAVITKLELSEENADKFKSVLKKLGVLDDLIQIIT